MLRLSKKARDVLPGLKICAVRVEGYGPAAARTDMNALERRVDAAADAAADLARSWRPVYGSMGLRPSKFLSSVEALSKRARKGDGTWRTGRPAVDLYNAFSIIHGVPMGGYDIAKLAGREIVLRPVCRESDRFNPIAGRVDLDKGGEQLLVYAADDDLLCWALNHRDSADFCIDSDTASALVISEGVTFDQAAASRAALADFADFLASHGARTEWIPGTGSYTDLADAETSKR